LLSQLIKIPTDKLFRNQANKISQEIYIVKIWSMAMRIYLTGIKNPTLLLKKITKINP